MRDRALFGAVHRRLTFLCAAITASILCLFSFLYLYLAERTLRDNQWSAFRQDMSNLSSSLEQQTVITHAYLSSLEQNSNYQIYLWDRGLPFHFNDTPRHTLSEEALALLLSQLPADNASTTDYDSSTDNTSAADYGPSTDNGSTADYGSVRGGRPAASLPSGEKCSLLSSGENWALLTLKTGDGQKYQVYLSRLSIGQPSAVQQLTGNREADITLLVVSSSQSLQEKVWLQRLCFLLIDLAGILLLTFFASFFTAKTLRPLRESHDRQVRFIADASHELRTPLAVIRACMHARPPAYEQTVDQECARMGLLIEDLLTLSQLETSNDSSGQFIKQQDVDLDTLLLTVYEHMELLAVQKEIRLELKLPQESLPHIRGDFRKLEQLLFILVQNALSYTPAKGTVTLKAVLASTVCIQVIDNGPGISDADKAHIFERFYRSQRSHTDRSHFGLGLCIAQEIALAHSAVLTVEDTVGGGTTFSLVLK